MAITTIGGNINSTAVLANLDYKYGPYNSLQEAYDTLGPNGVDKLAIGLTVGIIEDGRIREYWFKSGTDSVNNLVLKSEGKSAYDIAVEEGFEGTEQEWIDSLKGEKGDDAINPFKGWYDSYSNLPENPVIGDYAYVKGAESTDPAAIYECTTAGSWTDSGRTADTSNVQTFASSQEVNEVHIVNDLTTGGSDDVPSAEQVKILNDNKLSKTIEDDAFYVTDSNGYVICKIDADGVHAPNIQDNGGSIVIDNNKLLVTDANGYIVLRVDNNGIHSVVDKHAVACMVLSENYYPTSTPTRDSNGNVTHANVMFGTGVVGEIDITYTNGNASYVVVEYSSKQYAITINRNTNGNVTTVSVTEAN